MASAQPVVIEFKGICNASGAVAIDADTILVGDDEVSVLSQYRLTGGSLERQIPLDPSFGLKEADLEAGTVLGDRVVWIASHGRNSDGKPRPDRRQLFASHRIGRDTGTLTEAFSASFHGLLHALLQQTGAAFDVIKAAIGDPAIADPDLAPKRRGFNIEGMTADSSGTALMIGLRNPLRDERALVIRVDNPHPLLNGRTTQAIVGPVHELDLGKRSIRDFEWSAAHQAYLIIAGQLDDDRPGPGFAAYKWDGTGQPVQVFDFGDFGRDYDHFQPEVILPLPARVAGRLSPSKRVLVLSDDGKRPRTGGRTCKDTNLPKAERSFRGVIATVG